MRSALAPWASRFAVSAASTSSFRRCYGPEFVAKAVQTGLRRLAPRRLTSNRSPRENGYIEKLNARLRDGLLDGEIFYTWRGTRIIESWRRFYNTLRPHGSLGYKPPAPEVFIPATTRAAALSQPASPPALAPKPSMH